MGVSTQTEESWERFSDDNLWSDVVNLALTHHFLEMGELIISDIQVERSI